MTFFFLFSFSSVFQLKREKFATNYGYSNQDLTLLLIHGENSAPANFTGEKTEMRSLNVRWLF